MNLKRLTSFFTSAAVLLAILGVMDWGLKGLFQFDLFRNLFRRTSVARRVFYGLVGLAGTLLSAQLAISAWITATQRRQEERTALPLEHSIVGQPFPTVEGQTLKGQTVRLPDDAYGKVAFLALGFRYGSRWDVEKWMNRFRDRLFVGSLATRPDIAYYEMPMIGGLARIAAPLIDSRMRAATPDELQDHIVTVYGAMEPLRQGLGAASLVDTWVYLIDRDGTVLFQCGGAPSYRTLQELVTIAEAALRPASSEDLGLAS